jgi:flagellar basal-body rod protein FlgB
MDIDSLLFDNSLSGLEKALGLTGRRHAALSANIANAETPQYRAVDLHFGSELKRAFDQHSGSKLVRTHSQHLEMVRDSAAHLSLDRSGVTKADGNNVDIDLQMGRLRYNTSQYNLAASILRERIQQIKSVLREAM